MREDHSRSRRSQRMHAFLMMIWINGEHSLASTRAMKIRDRSCLPYRRAHSRQIPSFPDRSLFTNDLVPRGSALAERGDAAGSPRHIDRSVIRAHVASCTPARTPPVSRDRSDWWCTHSQQHGSIDDPGVRASSATIDRSIDPDAISAMRDARTVRALVRLTAQLELLE